MRPGTHNAITDVDGVLVGHATRDEPGWLTGVSVVLPPPGTVGGVDVRGGGPGTRETDLLDPANAVDAVDAVVLAGGSAFGLAAADGVADAVWAAGRGWPVGPGPDERVPIVPSAIVFDLGRAGVWRHHPGPADGATAHAAAASGPVVQGSVGAGTGARAGGLRGGVGTASAVLASGVTVGALVVVNAVGSPLAADGSLLGAAWALGDELGAVPAPSPAALERHLAARRAEVEAIRAGRAEAPRPGRATTLAVVATDAALGKAGCRRLATVAHDGMARALSPVHTAFDGDTVFTLATGARPAPDPFDLVELHDAAAGCVTRAIVHALLAADSVDRCGDGGMAALSWRDALTTP
ncbi:P1 family peptidase [Phycicoccus sp. MAQZ13P-2]|uniref:P1 family peptidase n=1 Tax=Phycicoccus mangrovi TaxID=2840470 RepID=UPI001C003EC2|nr:P1 family peptidase [Phycicoccus mangrovi]MBT9255233.1 P1 family peptidase [Phycicoccus mangrovi]MBT9274217.1 P1 family peptidase [Phycicoccus mangrovi]